MTRSIVPRGAVFGLAVVGAGAALAASMSGSAQAASSNHPRGDRHAARPAVAAPFAVAGSASGSGSGSGGMQTCQPVPGGPLPVPPGNTAEPDAVARAVDSAVQAAGTTGEITVSVGPDGVTVSGTGLSASQRAALEKQVRGIVHLDGHQLRLTLVTGAGQKAIAGGASGGSAGPTFQSGQSGPDANLPAPPPGAEGAIVVSSDPGPGLTLCGTPPAGSPSGSTLRRVKSAHA